MSVLTTYIEEPGGNAVSRAQLLEGIWLIFLSNKQHKHIIHMRFSKRKLFRKQRLSQDVIGLIVFCLS
jgi:hypothetical protein